jgi:hypothetical protein
VGNEGSAGDVARPERSRTQTRSSVDALTAASTATPVPDGVDPALWSVLTTEEKAFFQGNLARGPLTYGPGTARAASPGPSAGGRLDIRV